MKAILLVGGVGGVVVWWEWLVGGVEASVLDWKSGLDVLDDESKLGWRAMEMGVLIPVGGVFGWLHFCW